MSPEGAMWIMIGFVIVMTLLGAPKDK